MNLRNKALIIAILFAALDAASQAQAPRPLRTFTVVSEPGASVWLGSVFFGVTDSSGRLKIRTAAPGVRTVRVRAAGFSEASARLLPAHRGDLTVKLTPTNDEAELAFQEGERQSVLDRAKAIAAYRKAISIDPKLVRAHLALARNLAETGDADAALKVLGDVKKISPRNAEASAIEGRIYKDVAEEAKAISSFKRAIVEGRGFQPEAYTGLGLLYKEKAEVLEDSDPAGSEKAFDEAAKNLSIAVDQLSGAPDATIIMQLLGLIYEKRKRYNEAIAIYQEFLRLFPDSVEAEAVRSFIVQIRKEIARDQ
ncbi:MAG: tetratricopeptide repeat protein [Pyrinomonadaceae bacterium]